MLPKTAEYALRAVVWLGRAPDRPQSAEEMARAILVPRRYLHKVLQDLGKSGLIKSQPGPGGGYAIHRPPREISILDVVRAVGAVQRIEQCPLGLSSHTQLCPLHRELDRAFAAVEEAFARVTIAQILDTPSHILPLCDVTDIA